MDGNEGAPLLLPNREPPANVSLGALKTPSLDTIHLSAVPLTADIQSAWLTSLNCGFDDEVNAKSN